MSRTDERPRAATVRRLLAVVAAGAVIVCGAAVAPAGSADHGAVPPVPAGP